MNKLFEYLFSRPLRAPPK